MSETETRFETVPVLADGHAPTDIGNANRLVAYADGSIRWVDTWQTWLVWDQTAGHWALDNSKARIYEVAKAAIHNIINADTVESLKDPINEVKALATWAKTSSRVGSLDAMVKLARGVPGVSISHEEIDAKPYLLNVLNGTIDLETGKLKAHDREDLLMTQAPVMFDPSARLPLWDRCVETWQPRQEVREYLQRICGTGLSGRAMEAVYVNYGTGSNGKSKFYEAIGSTLGDFKTEPSKKLLTVTKHEPHETVVAALFGKRMAIASETDSHDQLNEASIKNLTGGDRLNARRMREDPWSFDPTHTLFMHTNYQPTIKGTDEGIWRRIKLIPWEVTIRAEDRDEGLAGKLSTDQAKSAILNWLLEGWLSYQDIGTAEPAIIEEATTVYRKIEDVLGVFISENIRTERGTTTEHKQFTRALESYCEERGIDQPSSGDLTKRLVAMGHVSKKRKMGLVWLNTAWIEETPGQSTEGDVGDALSGSTLETLSTGVLTETTSPTSPLTLKEMLQALSERHGDIIERAANGLAGES